MLGCIDFTTFCFKLLCLFTFVVVLVSIKTVLQSFFKAKKAIF